MDAGAGRQVHEQADALLRGLRGASQWAEVGVGLPLRRRASVGDQLDVLRRVEGALRVGGHPFADVADRHDRGLAVDDALRAGADGVRGQRRVFPSPADHAEQAGDERGDEQGGADGDAGDDGDVVHARLADTEAGFLDLRGRCLVRVDRQLPGGEVAQPGGQLAGVAVRWIRWDVALIAVVGDVAVCGFVFVRIGGVGVRGGRVGRPTADDGGALLGAEVAGGQRLGEEFLRDLRDRHVGQQELEDGGDALHVLRGGVIRQVAGEGEDSTPGGADADAVAVVHAQGQTMVVHLRGGLGEVGDGEADGQRVRAGVRDCGERGAVGPVGNHDHAAGAVDDLLDLRESGQRVRLLALGAVVGVLKGVCEGGLLGLHHGSGLLRHFLLHLHHQSGLVRHVLAGALALAHGCQRVEDGEPHHFPGGGALGLPEPGGGGATVVGEQAVAPVQDRRAGHQAWPAHAPCG